MLAQSFLSADELSITEPQRDALQKVLVLLETGKLVHVPDRTLSFYEAQNIILGSGEFSGEFSMATFGIRHTCGTAACIAGTAQLIAGVRFVGTDRPEELSELFYADGSNLCLSDITPSQAARALRSYLTTGNANWTEAVA